jgi:hypothetical protein
MMISAERRNYVRTLIAKAIYEASRDEFVRTVPHASVTLPFEDRPNPGLEYAVADRVMHVLAKDGALNMGFMPDRQGAG